MAILATLFTVGNATWAAWDQDMTYDEPFHLAWPERLLDERNDGREQFRFDSKTPAFLPAVLVQKGLESRGVDDSRILRFAARLQSVAMLVAVLFLVAALATTEDPRTAWIGLLLASLDPNLAAHGSIATTDVAYTAVVLLFVRAVGLDLPLLGRAAVLGVVLGLAFATKYTAVLLLPLTLLMFRGARTARPWAKPLALVLVAVAACITLNAAYLGVGAFQRLGEVPLQSPLLIAARSALRDLPLPFPSAVVTGIDASLAHNTPELWASYIFGQEHRGGVWYYFIAHWLMKTPIALILATMVGIFRLGKGLFNPVPTALALVGGGHLLYFSFFFATQIGLRFALPCAALACALAGRGLGSLRLSRLAALTALCLLERAPYWGDPIAFTNAVVQPKSRAFWFTADSNLDYGQNRDRVFSYAKRLGGAFVMDQATITPGRYVASANSIAIFDTRRSHRFLLDHNVPATNVGFTHFAFSITGERFDAYLDAARTTAAISGADGVCPESGTRFPPGGQVPFEQTAHHDSGRSWVICTSSRKGADLGFRVTRGRLWFGRLTEEGVCEADLLQEGQQAWFRIPRGVQSRLCIREIPLRRRSLPYLTSGYVTVRGQGATADYRQVANDSFGLNAAADPGR